MQKVLVAGGAGFIGSHLSRKLLQNGYGVVCIDNLITGDKKNIQDLLTYPHFEFIEYDITKPLTFFNRAFSSVNFIFHLASPASPSNKSKKSYINYPIETLLVNSIGTLNLLEVARENNARFAYASSSEIYGDPKVTPQNEDYWGNTNPNGVRSVYDEGKRFGESLTMAYHRKSKLDTRIMRIFNTYGPFMQNDDGRVVSNFINQALNNNDITIYGDGNQTRSFCYIDDLIDGIYKLMFTDGLSGEVVNLGSTDERRIIELATLIRSMLNSSSKFVFETLPEDDPIQRKPDIAKAKKLIDFLPKVSLEDGLSKTIKYYKQTK